MSGKPAARVTDPTACPLPGRGQPDRQRLAECQF